MGKEGMSNELPTPHHHCRTRTVAQPVRGNLTYFEELGFSPARVYWITSMGSLWKQWVVRGNHAHRTCKQMFFCLRGEARFEMIQQRKTINATLRPEQNGLYLPPMWWHRMSIKRGSVILALASERHDEAEYIRIWEEFAWL